MLLFEWCPLVLQFGQLELVLSRASVSLVRGLKEAAKTSYLAFDAPSARSLASSLSLSSASVKSALVKRACSSSTTRFSSARSKLARSTTWPTSAFVTTCFAPFANRSVESVSTS